MIHDLIGSIVSSKLPVARPIFDLAWNTAIGGKVLSQDPYAVDREYIRYVFGAGQPKPAPRFENHYMYMMTSRI